MKTRDILLAAVIVFLMASCGDKKEEQKTVSEPVKEEVIKAEPVVEEPEEVVEEVVEEPQIRTVIVKEGEWLYDISREEYGNTEGWQKIYDANKDKIDNPDMIFPNQELVIPE